MNTETLNIVKPSWGADNHQRESFVNRLVSSALITTLKNISNALNRTQVPPLVNHGNAYCPKTPVALI